MNIDIQKFNDYKETKLISAFPGCGKSHYYKNTTGKTILDSDSSTFNKSDFPQNYINHIKENIGKVDVILISSHKEVRDALSENGIYYTLVYPKLDLKDEYIKRYKKRGSDVNFINLLEKNWNLWITELDEQTGCDRIKLNSGEYLSDVI